MNKMKITLTCFTMILASGCQSDKHDSKLHYSSSMESAYAWQDNPPPSITWFNDARSGNYVCKLDSAAPYSVTFQMKLSDISSRTLKSVRVTAWVNMATMVSDPLVVVDIKDSSQKSVEYITKPAKDYVAGPNRWEQIVYTLNLDEKQRNKRNNFLRIYLLNTQHDYSLVDDIDVSFEEK